MTITYTPAPKVVGDVVSPVTITFNPFDPVQASGWNNLIWYMKLPTAITSSPMIMGDVMYFGLADGTLAEVDLSGMPSQGPARANWAQHADVHLTSGTVPLTSTVAGSHSMLAVATPNGLQVLHSPVTLVTEPDQITEINVEGDAAWVCDATTSFASTSYLNSSSELAGTVMGATKTPLNKPSVARRAPIGGTIIADTGNNRIVHVDRAGTELWAVRDFIDPGNPCTGPILPPGSPSSLNKPTDVTMWMDMEYDDPADISSSGAHPVYHYLIADGGNYRVLEIVAKYVPESVADRLLQLYNISVPPNTYQNMLRWSTRALAQGKQYRFASVRPVMPLASIYDPDEKRYATVGTLACTISDYDANSSTPDMTGGALVTIGLHDMTQSACSRDSQPISMITQLPIDQPGYPNPVHLFSPTFFNRQYISELEWHDLVIDAVGIHLVSYITNSSTKALDITVRTYKISDHQERCPGYNVTAYPPACEKRPLSPSYAQYLPNGNVLVSNKATWQDKSGNVFFGEIFEIAPVLDPVKDPNKIHLELVRDSSIVNVRQPMSAERQIF